MIPQVVLINKRYLRITYSDKKSSFDEFDKDGSASSPSKYSKTSLRNVQSSCSWKTWDRERNFSYQG